MTERVFVSLDIETTGLNPEEDFILEIAWAVVDSEFNILVPPMSFIVDHEENWQHVVNKLRNADSVVREMHYNSGLTQDVFSKAAYPMRDIVESLGVDIRNAKALVGGDASAHLMGLSVDFDKRFLLKDTFGYALFERDDNPYGFHHRSVDLTSVKLMLDASGITWQKASNSRPHRAINDVGEVVEQAKIFRRMFSALGGF